MGKCIASGYIPQGITICDNCYHHDVCGDKDYLTENKCCDFVNKELIVESPCKVGDTVYIIGTCKHIQKYFDNDYENGTGEIVCPFEASCHYDECDDKNIQLFKSYIEMIGIHDEDKVLKFNADGISNNFTLSDFGEIIFLEKEQAETALKAMGDDNNV